MTRESGDSIGGQLTESDYDERVKALRTLEKSRPLTAAELVQKSVAIQGGSGNSGSLEEAETALHAALRSVDGYVPALLELGWFYYAVKDDADGALRYFTKAIEICQEALSEANKGKDKCLEEMNDT